MCILLNSILMHLSITVLPHAHSLIDIVDVEVVANISGLGLFIYLLLYQLAVAKALL